MRPARAAAYLLGGVLLAAWLAAAAGVGRPSMPSPSPRSPEDANLDAVASGVQAQASRLRHRLAVAPRPQPPTRNPFAFAPHEIVVHRAPRPAPDPVQPSDFEPSPLEPDLALLGFAEEGSTRTAMFASGDQLLMASEGQTVAGRYRVGKVGSDVVELVDLVTGAIRRLALKSPVLLP